jgi:hypothetical protein
METPEEAADRILDAQLATPADVVRTRDRLLTEMQQPIDGKILEEALEFVERHSEPWYYSGQVLAYRLRRYIDMES